MGQRVRPNESDYSRLKRVGESESSSPGRRKKRNGFESQRSSFSPGLDLIRPVREEISTPRKTIDYCPRKSGQTGCEMHARERVLSGARKGSFNFHLYFSFHVSGCTFIIQRVIGHRHSSLSALPLGRLPDFNLRQMTRLPSEFVRSLMNFGNPHDTSIVARSRKSAFAHRDKIITDTPIFVAPLRVRWNSNIEV